MQVFKNPHSFQWDKGNIDKNWLKHKITNQDCEKAFYDHHKRVLKDKMHSGKEAGYILLGKANKQILFIVFTLRRNKVRVISARRINRKEKKLYAQKT